MVSNLNAVARAAGGGEGAVTVMEGETGPPAPGGLDFGMAGMLMENEGFPVINFLGSALVVSASTGFRFLKDRPASWFAVMTGGDLTFLALACRRRAVFLGLVMSGAETECRWDAMKEERCKLTSNRLCGRQFSGALLHQSWITALLRFGGSCTELANERQSSAVGWFPA